jgi:hypothetical protein
MSSVQLGVLSRGYMTSVRASTSHALHSACCAVRKQYVISMYMSTVCVSAVRTHVMYAYVCTVPTVCIAV